MGQLIAKYGAKKGTKIDYKDSLTWLELMGVTKLTAGKSGDTLAANNELIKIAVEQITTPDGANHYEALQIINLVGALDARDGMRLIKALTKLVQDDEDDDPKAVGQD